jgi:hypothetical protein
MGGVKVIAPPLPPVGHSDSTDEHESEQRFQYVKRYRDRLTVILKSGQVEEVAVIDT